MQRIEKHPEPVREEWTKYFVNDIECKRNDIHQTILDNKFYNGTVKLSKKYHFKLHEEKMVENREEGWNGSCFTLTSNREASKHDESSNKSASFSLDTDKFVAKINPTSDEFKLLIDKMANTIDMFYEASHNYSRYSQNLRSTIQNCIQFWLENMNEHKAPYDDILHEFSIEYFAFLFDIMAFSMSKANDNNISDKVELPSLKFDTSSIKESWSDTWTNSKKSQFVDEYLSVMLKQTDVIHQVWIKHDLFGSKLSRDYLGSKFDNFKNFLKSMQNKKTAHDVSLLINNQIVAPKPISTLYNSRMWQQQPQREQQEIEVDLTTGDKHPSEKGNPHKKLKLK